jgi:hypothetical protein
VTTLGLLDEGYVFGNRALNCVKCLSEQENIPPDTGGDKGTMVVMTLKRLVAVAGKLGL